MRRNNCRTNLNYTITNMNLLYIRIINFKHLKGGNFISMISHLKISTVLKNFLQNN